MERIKITDLDHIVLNVGDIEQSLEFYTEVLGLSGERVDEFKAGKVGFPSVRINAGTIIDLFPNKERSAPRAGAKVDGNLNHFCLVVGADDFSGTVDHPGDLGLFPRSRRQRDRDSGVLKRLE